MPKLQHTPGPWTFERSVAGDGIATQTIKASGNNTLAYTAFGNVGEAECLANASLIAASPDLLAACQRMARASENHGSRQQMMNAAMIAIRTAIAKAEGRAD